mmetsp:Transcript_90899/g.294122  ORF Transcript_90899/g.294122 Transcript_90899/m.294122 type:complete len:230 (-) Transcript_90899:197-886(-)
MAAACGLRASALVRDGVAPLGAACVDVHGVLWGTREPKQGSLVEPELLRLHPQVKIERHQEDPLQAVHLPEVYAPRLGVVAVRVDEVLVVLHSDHKARQEDAVNVAHGQGQTAAVVFQQAVDNDERRDEGRVAAAEGCAEPHEVLADRDGRDRGAVEDRGRLPRLLGATPPFRSGGAKVPAQGYVPRCVTRGVVDGPREGLGNALHEGGAPGAHPGRITALPQSAADLP